MSKKILVIEDDPNTSMFVEYTLEQQGYQVVSAKNGKERSPCSSLKKHHAAIDLSQ